MEALEHYDWPGNVRELDNALTRASILARGATVGLEHLRLGSDSPGMGGFGGEDEGVELSAQARAVFQRTPEAGPDWTLDGAIARQCLRVLEHTDWNKSEASRLLEISRSRLARIVDKFDLEELRD
jgi:DNA-binding NtrC family response regulator